MKLKREDLNSVIRYCKRCNCVLIRGDNISEKAYDHSHYYCTLCERVRKQDKPLTEAELLAIKKDRDYLKEKLLHKSECKHTGGGIHKDMPECSPRFGYPTTQQKVAQYIKHEENNTNRQTKQDLIKELANIPEDELESFVLNKIEALEAELELYRFMAEYLIR